MFSKILFGFFLFSCTSCLLHALEVDTYSQIIQKYKNGDHIRILLVPGHDDEFSGAEIDGRTEASMNLEMSEVLGSYLSQDKQLEITYSRDLSGYNPRLITYMNEHKENIWMEMLAKKALTLSSIEKGDLQIADQVSHVHAADKIAQILYSINSWADSEHFDFVIHIHFNDYVSRNTDKIKKYSGFSIYTPSNELLNATTSAILANSIAKRMKATFSMSNLPSEQELSNENAVIPDFYLIAMGAYKTANVPRILIEYSYIFEDHLKVNFFTISAQTFARSTAFGVHDFLTNHQNMQSKNLEYHWDKILGSSKKSGEDVLALQFGLRELGFFPPNTSSREKCYFTGVYGDCTKKALNSFQKSRGLTQTAYFNGQSKRIFNNLFKD